MRRGRAPVVYSVANFEYVWGEVPGGTHVEKLPAGGSQFKGLKLLKLQNTGSRLKWGGPEPIFYAAGNCGMG